MKKYTQLFGWLMGVVGTVLGIIGIVQLFEDQSLVFKIAVVVSIFVLIAFSSMIITIISNKRTNNLENGFIGDKSIMIQENRKYIENMYKNKEFNDVCNIGAVFSRVFYIAAAYQSRYKIAIMVYKSADYLNRDKLCATTLLDLGWTALLLGKKKAKSFSYCGKSFDSPDDFFLKSIDYSAKINDYALVSKAHRHLHGYYLSIGNFADAEIERTLCEENIMKLPDGSDKKKILADLYYIDAETAFFKKNYAFALSKCLEADKLKKGLDDETREIRYYAQIGKIKLMQHDIDSAMTDFSKGLEVAKRLKRIDEVTKNTYGYAICLLIKGQRHEAESMVRNIEKKFGAVPLFITDEILRTEYKKKVLKHSSMIGDVN